MTRDWQVLDSGKVMAGRLTERDAKLFCVGYRNALLHWNVLDAEEITKRVVFRREVSDPPDKDGEK